MRLRTLYRTFGVQGTVRRARFEARLRLGRFKRHPTVEPAGDFSPDPDGRVYRPHQNYLALDGPARARVIDAADHVVSGRHHAFGGEWRALPDDDAAWRGDPATGFAFDNVAWWRISHLPAACDIKNVWEPARFAWVYDLTRAFALTGDARYRDTFTRHFRSWRRASPPFLGPHWSCGQETAIRALALLHAEAVLLATDADVEARQEVRQTLWISGERIADAIEYGLSQRNNHGISEAAGLIHLGVRFRAEHPAAEGWCAAGRRLLAEQIRDQFSADGWYAQHSFTYTRTAMDQAVMAQRVLQQHGLSLPEDCLTRLRAAVALMSAAVCDVTGVLPNHGANDGGRVLTYSSAPYRDFRPALTLAAVVLGAALPADVPPDPEVVAWLGAQPAVGEPRCDGVVTGTSGWAVARAGAVSVFLRAGELRHRPSHLDSLHLDVRYGAREVILDPGSYAYNALPPWRNGLVSAMVHNGPLVNDQEPGVRGPRFLWWAWPLAELRFVTDHDGAVTLEAHLLDAESRRPVAERRVHVTPRAVRVDDRHELAQPATMQVTWLLAPGAPATVTTSGAVAEQFSGAEGATVGWFSPTYGVRIAARTLRLRAVAIDQHAHVVTQIEFGDTTG